MVNVCSIIFIFVVIGAGYAGLQPISDCAAVRCAHPACEFPKTIPGHCCPTCPLLKDCWYKKKFYKNGSSFKDDCNTCWCRNGRVACTEIACVSKSCFYKRKWYTHGTSFKDDCNTCQCRNGQVLCTKKACLGCRYGGKYYKEGQSIPQIDPCKSCFCRNGKVVCETMMCPAVYCENPLKKPGACCPVCLPVLQAEQ